MVDLETEVLVVDDDASVRQIVAEILTEQGYSCRIADGPGQALELLEQAPVGLVITDIKMPDRDGLWLLARLRELNPDTAVVMMTGFGHIDTAVECLRNGASDYLTKPIRVTHLSTSVARALERRRLLLENRAYQRELETRVQAATRELQEAYQQVTHTYHRTLEALITALDAREHETGDHSQRVVRYTLALGDRLGLEGERREHLARGALLHDIGKIGVPDHILLKPGRLTDEEWVEMRLHPEIGFRILQGIPFLTPAADMVLAHQERYDGNGYPHGLKEEAIPLGARIFSVADTFDAITSDRPYRKAREIQLAIEEINRCSGTQFDPQVVAAFNEIPPTTWSELRERRD